VSEAQDRALETLTAGEWRVMESAGREIWNHLDRLFLHRNALALVREDLISSLKINTLLTTLINLAASSGYSDEEIADLLFDTAQQIKSGETRQTRKIVNRIIKGGPADG